MWKPKVGMRVRHAILGPGEIIGLQSSALLRVRLDGYKAKEVLLEISNVEPQTYENGSPDDDLTKVGPNNSGNSSLAKPCQPTAQIPLRRRKARTLGADTFRYRKAIDALRFGLVPEDFIESLTIGFGELEKWVLDRLPGCHNGAPQVSEIWGPFGSGKSHTMSVIRNIARRENYATVRVEVDGQNISLSDPEKLLCSLWSSLDANGFESPTPLLDLNIKAIDNGHAPPNIAPVGIDRIRENYSTIKLVKDRGHIDKYSDPLDALISSSDEYTANEVATMIWKEPNINGLEASVKRMIGRRVAERPYDFVEALVGNAHIAELAGYDGLVVTIDEFEVEVMNSKNIDRVSDLLRVLALYFQGQLSHNEYPVSIFFATVGQEGNRGDKYVDSLIESANGGWYEIPEIGADERSELASRMHELYTKAYELTDSYDARTTDEVEEQVGIIGANDSGIIRSFIKRYIALLDSQFGPSGDRLYGS